MGGNKSMKRNFFYILAVAAVLSLALHLSVAPEANAAAEKIDISNVLLKIGDQHKIFPLLKVSGELKNLPFKAEFSHFNGAAPLFEAIRAGAIETTWAGDAPHVAAINSGADIRLVAALNNSKPESTRLIVQKNSPIKKIEDLKGKTVHISAGIGSVAHYLLLRALLSVGLSPEDVNVRVILPADGMTGFINGDIEVWGWLGNQIDRALKQSEGREIVNSKGFAPGTVFIGVSTKSLQNPASRAAIVEFLKYAKKGYDYRNAHREDVLEQLAEYFNMEVDEYRPVFESEEIDTLRKPTEKDIEDLQVMNDIYYKYGVLENHVEDMHTVFDLTVFHE
jgi:sulfonate transport system substrate-binding protein